MPIHVIILLNIKQIEMKRTFFLVALLATLLMQHGFAQTGLNTLLLHSYYDIKNALVAGNANTAALEAAQYLKTLDSFDTRTVNEATRKFLSADANEISKSKDIKHQREHFAALSANMYSLAKAIKLTDEPIYYAYCPMQKAHWLSSVSTIKNPYFGTAMLTCGKVEETIK